MAETMLSPELKEFTSTHSFLSLSCLCLLGGSNMYLDVLQEVMEIKTRNNRIKYDFAIIQ